MDQRAQANGLISFLAILALGALLFILFKPAVDAVLTNILGFTSNPEAESVINQRLRLFGYLPVYALFVGVLKLIARSVFQSRSVG
jgi:hypothetical protein